MLTLDGQELKRYEPWEESWSQQDGILFQQAFQYHGKSFRRLRQLLPDKSIGQLVCHYYDWKKSRDCVSLLDQRERVERVAKEEGRYSEEGVEGQTKLYQEIDLTEIINEAGKKDEGTGWEAKLRKLKTEVQLNKQGITNLQEINKMKVFNYHKSIPTFNKSNGLEPSKQWTSEEVELAKLGIKSFDKDYAKIASIIQTKSKEQVQTFYNNYQTVLSKKTKVK